MAKKVYEESNIAAIADAIRAKTSAETTYKPAEMKDAISEVYDAGKQSEHDSFWADVPLDSIGGNSFSGNAWNDNNFKPPRDIRFAAGVGMNWSFSSNNITNLKACLERQGVSLDCSKVSTIGYGFRGMQTSELPEINLTNIKKSTGLQQGLCQNAKLVTIDKLILSTTWTEVSNASGFLVGNSKLENIVVEGIIPCSISLAVSPLTAKSVKSIISCLKDYSATDSEYAYTITFKASAFEALEAEGAASPNGNTWAEYIDDLKWNLTTA